MDISAKLSYSILPLHYKNKPITFDNKKIGKIIKAKLEKDSVIITAKIYKKYEKQFADILKNDNRLFEVALKDQKVVVMSTQCERGI